MTIKNMLQAPWCGKTQLAAETRMAAGLAIALAWLSTCSFAHLPAAGQCHERPKHSKKSRREKSRRLKLDNL